jgi:hypothetical protein
MIKFKKSARVIDAISAITKKKGETYSKSGRLANYKYNIYRITSLVVDGLLDVEPGDKLIVK